MSGYYIPQELTTGDQDARYERDSNQCILTFLDVAVDSTLSYKLETGRMTVFRRLVRKYNFNYSIVTNYYFLNVIKIEIHWLIKYYLRRWHSCFERLAIQHTQHCDILWYLSRGTHAIIELSLSLILVFSRHFEPVLKSKLIDFIFLYGILFVCCFFKLVLGIENPCLVICLAYRPSSFSTTSERLVYRRSRYFPQIIGNCFRFSHEIFGGSLIHNVHMNYIIIRFNNQPRGLVIGASG